MTNGSASESTVLCRLLIGHDTQLLDKPTDDHRTHRWKVIVSAPRGCPTFTDRSFVRKVTFQLHESFSTPKRTVRRPPFELEETGYGEFLLAIVVQFAGIDKKFTLSYEITLPMGFGNAPKEFVTLATNYGGRLKTSRNKMDSSLLNKVKEFSAAPAALLSPIGKLMTVNSALTPPPAFEQPARSHFNPTPPPSDGASVDKDEVYWDKVTEISRSLFCPVQHEKYGISFLHSSDSVPKELVHQFERTTPLVDFNPAFMSYKLESSPGYRSYFERRPNQSEPQMLRLLVETQESEDE